MQALAPRESRLNYLTLATLDLRNTDVSNIGPLKRLTKLSKLYLIGTQVSDAAVNDLKNTNKNLEIIR